MSSGCVQTVIFLQFSALTYLEYVYTMRIVDDDFFRFVSCITVYHLAVSKAFEVIYFWRLGFFLAGY
jgi:hypothetical protein